MSLRYEQYRAIKQTRDFLRSILMRPYPYKSVYDIRKVASMCLKHYPFLRENGEPMWSKDPFTEDACDICGISPPVCNCHEKEAT